MQLSVVANEVSLHKMGDEALLRVDIEIPFPDSRLAEVAFHVLRVDAEPKRGGVSKQLRVTENILKANFSAKLARQLRVAINGFFDNVHLITETIELLGPPASEKFDHF